MKKLFWKDRKRQEDGEIVLETPQNEYYESVSARLGVVQVILYLSLLAFVVLSFFRNTNLITYQNFYYFFKDLNASAETVDVFASDSVSYPTSDNQSFTLYRKGLAVVGNNAVTVFTATGRQTLSKSISYQNPVAVGSGKYLLVYELGGTQYSLYNSYTQLYSGRSDFPIYGASVSDSGMYALLSHSEQYNSVVSLYSSNFALLNRYNKNGYVMDVALNEKGTLLALLTSSSQNGLYQTEVSLHIPREGGNGTVTSIGSSLGLSLSFTASGGISVLCGNGISYVTADGKLSSFYDFEGKEILCAELSEDGAAVCLRSSAISEKNHVIVFDKSGKMLYNGDVTDTVTQITRSGNSVYWVTANRIDLLELSSGEVVASWQMNTDRKTVLAVDEDEFLLCSRQKAEYIRSR